MMFLPMLFALCALAAASSPNYYCAQDVRKTCEVDRVPNEIPETMEDLKRACLIVQNIAKCMSEEFAKCGEHFSFYATHMGEIAEFLERTCDEENPLYQAISRNYECIKPVAESLGLQCTPRGEEWEKIQNLISKVELSPAAKQCEYALYHIVCTANIFGKQCGEETQEAVMDILSVMTFDSRECYEESVLRELRPLKEIFEASFTEQPEVEENDILEEIKEALDK